MSYYPCIITRNAHRLDLARSDATKVPSSHDSSARTSYPPSSASAPSWIPCRDLDFLTSSRALAIQASAVEEATSNRDLVPRIRHIKIEEDILVVPVDLFTAQHTSCKSIMQHVPNTFTRDNCSLSATNFSNHLLAFERGVIDEASESAEFELRVGDFVDEGSEAYNLSLESAVSGTRNLCCTTREAMFVLVA